MRQKNLRNNASSSQGVIFATVLLVIISLIIFYVARMQKSSVRNQTEVSPDSLTPSPEVPNGQEDQGDGVFCTLDAKLCPDGSYVSRVPPNCEFSLCPEEEVVNSEDVKTDMIDLQISY